MVNIDSQRGEDLTWKQPNVFVQQECVGNNRRECCYYTWTLCKRDRTSEKKQDVRLDLGVEETKLNLVSPESAMFCVHLSHFGYAVQLLPERGFSCRACDEEMFKQSLVLTLLKIICQYQRCWVLGRPIFFCKVLAVTARE